MPPNNPFPIDVERVQIETDPHRVNECLGQGWTLLLVYACLDGIGGYFGVYVLGKRRPVTDRTFPDQDFDQRHG